MGVKNRGCDHLREDHAALFWDILIYFWNVNALSLKTILQGKPQGTEQ